MKTLKLLLGIFFFSLLFINLGYSQNEDRYQMYIVHEDHLKPEMKKNHETADKALLEAAKKNNLSGMNWLTYYGDDNKVMYLSPISSFAELDKDPFEDLQNKMGDEAYQNLFKGYDNTYTEHGDYILRLDKELSYMPQGMTQTPENKNYRSLTFYHISPENGEKAEQMARDVKKLYEEKGSTFYYRVYKSGFGTMGNYYMVAVAAENPQELQQMQQKNQELIGEEGLKLFESIDATASKIENSTGYIKPELSYID